MSTQPNSKQRITSFLVGYSKPKNDQGRDKYEIRYKGNRVVWHGSRGVFVSAGVARRALEARFRHVRYEADKEGTTIKAIVQELMDSGDLEIKPVI